MTRPEDWLRAAAEGSLSKPEQWTCHACESRGGVATSIAVRVTLSPMVRDGRVVDGTPAWVCACCLAKGITTRIP